MNRVVVPIDVLIGMLLLHEIDQQLKSSMEQNLVFVVPTRPQRTNGQLNALGFIALCHFSTGLRSLYRAVIDGAENGSKTKDARPGLLDFPIGYVAAAVVGEPLGV